MGIQGVVPPHILVHTAVPLQYVEDQTNPVEWIEGEPGPHGGGGPTEGEAFSCVLFMPAPGGAVDNAYRPRVVRVPTMLYNPKRPDNTPIVIDNEDELMVTAPELAPWTGGVTVRWQADGLPQPFGRPGTVLGILAQLRRIED